MRIPYHFGPRWLRRWLERHQHPVSFALHMVGIPMTVVGVVVAILGELGWGAGLFVLGYFLQFIGHCIEGNDMGELILFKRLLGRPYVAVSPRWQTAQSNQSL
jgi:uncharacterized membrane protein YGL010W